MKRSTRALGAALGIAAMLVTAVLPLSNVSAHWCRTPLTVHPSQQGNPDTGCDGASCPANAGTMPHEHENWLEGKKCRNHGKRVGHANGKDSPGGPGLVSVLADHCPHSYPHTHTYGFSGTETLVGVAVVTDSNTADCDGDGIGGDFDGDYDSGVGGGFFGYGPWANEAVCNYGLETHGGSVVVNDAVFGSDVWMTVGAMDTNGPVIITDPVTGGTTCSTDGSITPGDPALDPTADPDDCLTDSQNLYRGVGTGATCGAGGDGGYWVFLERWTLDNAPTSGTLTA